MLPEHYKMACRHLSGFRHVFPALGAHPLRCSEAESQLSTFLSLAKATQFVGEIGLDGSAEGRATLARQKSLFHRALGAIEPGCFVTVHSRNAWREALDIIAEVGVGPLCFHYFTGGPAAAAAVVGAGHFISANHKMVQANGRHREMVKTLPRDRILVESDAPFTGGADPVPMVRMVYEFLSEAWGVEMSEVEASIERNFQSCRTRAEFGPRTLFQDTPKGA
jgi:TatD DNase family protein